MLQTDWQEQTERQMMEADLTIYNAEYYLLFHWRRGQSDEDLTMNE